MKYIYIHYFFLILIVLFFSFINSRSKKDTKVTKDTKDKKENFTSQINSYYRPISRQYRLTVEHYKNQAKKKYTETVDYIYKKIGLK